MNVLFFVVLAIFAISFFNGYRKGLIKIAVSLAVTIASFILVFVLSPFVSSFLVENTSLDTYIEEKCGEIVGTDGFDSIEGSREEQEAAIANSSVPEFIQEILRDNNNDVIKEELNAESFSDYIEKYMARIIINVISFLITFIIISILSKVLIKMCGIFSKIPVIGKLNHIGGGAVGLAMGLAIVWVAFIAITIFCNTDLAKTCFAQIGENGFLSWLYNNNVLMQFIANI